MDAHPDCCADDVEGHAEGIYLLTADTCPVFASYTTAWLLGNTWLARVLTGLLVTMAAKCLSVSIYVLAAADCEET